MCHVGKAVLMSSEALCLAANISACGNCKRFAKCASDCRCLTPDTDTQC